MGMIYFLFKTAPANEFQKYHFATCKRLLLKPTILFFFIEFLESML